MSSGCQRYRCTGSGFIHKAVWHDSTVLNNDKGKQVFTGNNVFYAQSRAVFMAFIAHGSFMYPAELSISVCYLAHSSP